ncbi:MAG: SEC-C metal-binding domain-containing protein, partial [Patescibacteria group bacterium]
DEQKTEIQQTTQAAAQDKEALAEGRTEVIVKIMEIIRAAYDNLYDVFEDRKSIYNIERGVILRSIDTLWIDHLAAMSALRTGIGLQGYGQRDPLVEYKREGFGMFQNLLGSINHEITYTFFKYAKHAVDMKVQMELGRSVFQKAGVTLQGAVKTSNGSSERPPSHLSTEALAKAEGGLQGVIASSEKLGRNEPCHCGSGKKFKKCHGQ